MPPTCVPRQVSSISFPVPFDKGNVGNEVSGFRGQTKPTSILFSAWQSLIFALMWFFLHFTPSLRFTFSLQSALILPPVRSLKSAARSPQPAVLVLHWPVFRYLVWQNVLILAHCILRLFAGKVSIENRHVLWFPRMKHNTSQFC